MKKKKIIEILLIFLGISLILYPTISNYISSYNQTISITNYEENIEKMTKEEIEEEIETAKNYNEELEKDTMVDLSLSGEKDEENNTSDKTRNSSYLNVLNIGEIMAYISIPKINVYLPIYHGSSEKVLQSGIGHLEKTSLPVGGKGTHCVLAGHTGLARMKVFDDLDKLEKGDVFYIYVLGEEHIYEVDKLDIVKPNNTNIIKIEDDKDYITLITCTPRVLNTHRLLVRGTRLENSKEEIDTVNMPEQEKFQNNDNVIQLPTAKDSNIKWIYIIIVIAIILGVTFYKYLFRCK